MKTDDLKNDIRNLKEALDLIKLPQAHPGDLAAYINATLSLGHMIWVRERKLADLEASPSPLLTQARQDAERHTA
jgi:hypothetical protein